MSQGLLSGVLPTIFEAGNRIKRYRNALLQDPIGNANALAESLAVDINDQMQAPQWRNSLLGMPADPNAVRAEQNKLMGLLAGAGVIRGTWYKGMYPYDYTKEAGLSAREIAQGKQVAPGPLLDPRDTRRPSPFPTFDPADPEGLTNVRGFFASDPAVANRFAGLTSRGAVFPVKLHSKNTLRIDAKGKKAGEVQFGPSGKAFRDAARSGKYDAIVIKNTADEGDVAVMLDGSGIRSVFDR